MAVHNNKAVLILLQLCALVSYKGVGGVFIFTLQSWHYSRRVCMHIGTNERFSTCNNQKIRGTEYL